jgi:hypothetical protein
MVPLESEYMGIPSELTDEFNYILDKIVEFEWEGKNRKNFSVVEAWTEHEEVALNYIYQHCQNCEDSLNTFRIPKTLLDAENFKEQVDVHFIELESDRRDKLAREEHFKDIISQRAKIKLLRQLAQEFPEYLDLSVELPELPDYPELSHDYEEPTPGVMLLTKNVSVL